MSIDYKKLTIDYAFANPWWKEWARPEPEGYDSYEDIPDDDRSPNKSGHVYSGSKILGLLDSKKVLACHADNKYMMNRQRVVSEIPFIAACRAVIALSNDEQLTKEYQFWLSHAEGSLESGLRFEWHSYNELTSPENLEKNYKKARKVYRLNKKLPKGIK